jgi:hypothetical protein
MMIKGLVGSCWEGCFVLWRSQSLIGGKKGWLLSRNGFFFSFVTKVGYRYVRFFGSASSGREKKPSSAGGFVARGAGSRRKFVVSMFIRGSPKDWMTENVRSHVNLAVGLVGQIRHS